MLGLGHEYLFPVHRLNARCQFGKGTFARTHGNGRDAPMPVVRITAAKPINFDPSGPSLPREIWAAVAAI
jgi:hypothetical protein